MVAPLGSLGTPVPHRSSAQMAWAMVRAKRRAPGESTSHSASRLAGAATDRRAVHQGAGHGRHRPRRTGRRRPAVWCSGRRGRHEQDAGAVGGSGGRVPAGVGEGFGSGPRRPRSRPCTAYVVAAERGDDELRVPASTPMSGFGAPLPPSPVARDRATSADMESNDQPGRCSPPRHDSTAEARRSTWSSPRAEPPPSSWTGSSRSASHERMRASSPPGSLGVALAGEAAGLVGDGRSEDGGDDVDDVAGEQPVVGVRP